jgi:hypothetical protein
VTGDGNADCIMTGPEHWAEADRIVTGPCCDYGCPLTGCEHEMAYLGRAAVHALLALATAVMTGCPPRPGEDTVEFPRPGPPPPGPRPYIS